jgi:ABC-type transport system involved in multi-copper enzyme maturation permease subunit
MKSTISGFWHSLRPSLVIAKNTYREISRERLLYGVWLAAALLTGASFFLATISLDQNARVLQNTGLASIHLLTVFITVFVATNSMAHDVDRRALYFLFPKPVSKQQYVVGKYLGFILFLLSTLLILGGLFSIGVAFLNSSVLGAAAINLAFSFLEVSLLIALATLFASFTAPLNAALYTLSLFFIGHSQSTLKAFVADMNNRFLEWVINGVYYILPNLEKFDVRKATLYQVEIPAMQVVWAVTYWVFAIVIVLYLATLVFRKQEV